MKSGVARLTYILFYVPTYNILFKIAMCMSMLQIIININMNEKQNMPKNIYIVMTYYLV